MVCLHIQGLRLLLLSLEEFKRNWTTLIALGEELRFSGREIFSLNSLFVPWKCNIWLEDFKITDKVTIFKGKI